MSAAPSGPSDSSVPQRETNAHGDVSVESDPHLPVQPEPQQNKAQRPVEIGGPAGPDPTRYGDWERKGRCIDF